MTELSSTSELAQGLVAHWPFAGDGDDHGAHRLPTRDHGVELCAGGPGSRAGAARFNGTGAHLEVADHPALHLGTGDFSVSAWVCSDNRDGDVVGQLLGKFDPERRCGLNVYVLSITGVASNAQSNYRHLHFGIDDARADDAWQDCGRPGNAASVEALTSSNGLLYACTLETGASEVGRLWRHDGGQRWIDLGNPVGCNSVRGAVEFEGKLYCALGRYDTRGSGLGDAQNRTPGGQVYRVEDDGHWIYCGRPGEDGAVSEETPTIKFGSGKADDAMALVVYRGALYAVSNHRTGIFKFEGGESWRHVGLPEKRTISLAVHQGNLYTMPNGGPVYRYEGDGNWTDCGTPTGNEQVYSAVTHYGRMFVGTWPDAALFSYEGEANWTPVNHKRGWVGMERELMGMALYNGKVYMGTLPMANVYRLDRKQFTQVGNLDTAPVTLRRVWSMAVHEGKLFAGTLPSGRVSSFEAGKLATWDYTFPTGWRHVAAVRTARRLKLYVEGQLVAWSAPLHPAHYNLDNDQPLTIGYGAYDYWRGAMSDVRLYNRALGESEIRRLAAP